MKYCSECHGHFLCLFMIDAFPLFSFPRPFYTYNSSFLCARDLCMSFYNKNLFFFKSGNNPCVENL